MLYLTYEELKLFIKHEILKRSTTCCTLPMRNWNFFFLYDYVLCFVVPYLWGIETITSITDSLLFNKLLYLTYEELKPYFFKEFLYHNFFLLMVVPYLWGIETVFSTVDSSCAAVVVPYLWGIETVYSQAVI